MSLRVFATAVFLLCATGLFVSCSHKHHDVTRGFYYWRTTYKLSNCETTALNQLQVKRIYIRMFDVDWEFAAQCALPIAPILFPAHLDSQISYVPVVFITQRALTKTSAAAIPVLAGNIVSLVNDMCRNVGITPSEVQIDFDWTATSRASYFQLLKALKQQAFLNGKSLSCTIRLHQVKYASSSGIPPVDKGLLMCYNMGDMKKPGASNSILDVGEAKEYLGSLNGYPLHLDIALPLFSWCLLFDGAKLKGILRNISPEMVSSGSLFAHKKGNLFACLRDTSWEGYDLKTNDIIRVESPTINDIKSIAEYASQIIKNSDLGVVFFHCDSLTLSKFSANELETVYSVFN